MFLSNQLKLNLAQIHRGAPLFLSLLHKRFSSPSSSDVETEEDIAQARKWLSSFTLESVPRKSCEITFSRASGPGGQNVNKLNTKATLRLNLKEHGFFINPYILEKVRQNSTYITKHDELVIQCDTHRSQPKNTEECFRRLHSTIANAARLPGETTDEAKKNVAKFEKRSKERRLQEKKTHSSKKDARRGQRDD